jgi:hypothetical protein
LAIKCEQHIINSYPGLTGLQGSSQIPFAKWKNLQPQIPIGRRAQPFKDRRSTVEIHHKPKWHVLFTF